MAAAWRVVSRGVGAGVPSACVGAVRGVAGASPSAAGVALTAAPRLSAAALRRCLSTPPAAARSLTQRLQPAAVPSLADAETTPRRRLSSAAGAESAAGAGAGGSDEANAAAHSALTGLAVDPDVLAARPVPKSAKEYALNRREYRRQLTEYRKRFKAEWETHVEALKREAEAAEEQLEQQREAKRRMLEVRKARIAIAHAVTRREENKLAEYNRLHRSKHRARFVERMEAKRRQWLADLVEESKTWITEDTIDERINEDLFGTRHPWHLEEWYAHKEKHRVRREASKRGSVVGLLADEPDTDDEYGSEWEDDVDEINLYQQEINRKSQGIQLEELLWEKPIADIETDLRHMERAYFAKHGIDPSAHPERGGGTSTVDDFWQLLDKQSAADGDAGFGAAFAGGAEGDASGAESDDDFADVKFDDSDD